MLIPVMRRWEELRPLAQHAEAIGLDSMWMVDHFQVDHIANARQAGREVTPEVEAQGVEGAGNAGQCCQHWPSRRSGWSLARS